MREEDTRKNGIVARLRRKRSVRYIVAVVLAVLVVAGGGIWFRQKRLPHFHTVSGGRLYRSGQPRGIGLHAVRLRGVKTVVNLRKPHSDGVQAEREYMEDNDIAFHIVSCLARGV